MALFGFGKQKKSPPAEKKKPPVRRKTIDTVMERASIALVENLARDDPNVLRKILVAELASKRNWKLLPEEKPPDAVDQYFETKAKLKKAGLDTDAEDDNWLKQLLPAVGVMLMQLQGNQINPRGGEPAANGHQQLPEPARPAALNPAPENNMNWVSPYLISQLSGKDSAQAYNWLVSLNRSEITAMFDAIRKTPDDQMHAFWATFAERNPDFRQFVYWALERPEWYRGLIAIIKQPTNEPSHQGGGHTGL